MPNDATASEGSGYTLRHFWRDTSLKPAALTGLLIAGVVCAFGAVIAFPAVLFRNGHAPPRATPAGHVVVIPPQRIGLFNSQIHFTTVTSLSKILVAATRATEPVSGLRASPGRPVALKVSAGFDNQYRWLTTVPVRITAHNRTNSTISGTVVVPATNTDPAEGYSYGPNTAYEAPMVLPAESMKQVTLYLPASALSYVVQAQMQSGGRLLGSGVAGPTSFGSNVISVGALTADPLNTLWLNRVKPGGGESIRAIRLTPATVDPLASVLQNFGAIVLEDGSTTQLTAAQISALQTYVASGGGLILVGGPGWQQSIKALPRSLVPGRVSGIATLPNLKGLETLGAPTGPGGRTVVSVLRAPSGSVLAAQDGIPLVVDRNVGLGHIVYLAFDPGLNPVAAWPSAGRMLGRIVIRANPSASALGVDWSSRNSLLSPSSFFSMANGASSDMADELKNVPSAALGSVILFVAMAAFFVIILGPLLFLVLRRRGRQEWAWALLPVGALLSTGATFGVARVTQSHNAIVNTIGMVTLTGPQSARPADFYMGVFAPLAGNYHLSYPGQAIPQVVPEYGAPTSGPIAVRLRQGATTDAFMEHMPLWSMRSVEMSTSISVRGDIDYSLRVTKSGEVAGWVRNGTSLSLIHPAIIAGRWYERLPAVPPGKTVTVRVTPGTNVYNHSSMTMWERVLGQYDPDYCCGSGGVYDSIPPSISVQPASRGGGTVALGGDCMGYGGCQGCCFGYGPAPEHSLGARLRNAATQMPSAQQLDALGEVVFVGWNEQPLIPLTVNGGAPDRRDLNLIVKPLTVTFPPGPFRLRTGTIGANLIDVRPAAPNGQNCCNTPIVGAIELGHGGSATYEFDLHAKGQVHLAKLSVYVDAGGANGRNMGRIWNCTDQRWISYDLSRGVAHLSNPQPFVSTKGTILVKLVANDGGSDMYFPDARRDIQIAGSGWVGRG